MRKIPVNLKERVGQLIAEGVVERESVKKIKQQNPARRIEIEVGDTKQDDFYPQFNKLTYVKRVGSASNGDILWLCSCFCGNEKVARKTHVVHGRTTSCGCARKGKQPAKGMRHTVEFKENLRKRLLGKRPACAGWNKGKKIPKHQSEILRKRMSGTNNHGWKGGITPLTQKIRRSLHNKNWRTAIFKRDNYTCVLCGTRGGYLEVDHYPVKFSEIFQSNNIASLKDAIACPQFWDITKCRPCHDDTKV